MGKICLTCEVTKKMNKAELIAFKEWKHDELQQAKVWHKRVKRLVIYKDNAPYRYDRFTGNWDYRLKRNQ